MHPGVSRTRLFVNLTAGLELLRYVPAAHRAEVGFCLTHPDPDPNPDY